MLIKLVETLFIDEQSVVMLRAFETHQVGCGTPDGAPLIVYTARSWADNLRAKSQPAAADFDLELPDLAADFDFVIDGVKGPNGRPALP